MANLSNLKRDVYKVDFKDAGNTGTLEGFENETMGESVHNFTYSLTVDLGKTAPHWKYRRSTWTCTMSTIQCIVGGQSNEVSKILKEPRVIIPPALLLDNDEVICGSRYFDTVKMVTCQTTSDPMSTVHLSGSALDSIQEQTCEQEADGWRCSVTATYVRSGNVVCKAFLLHEGETCACSSCDKEIRITDAEGKPEYCHP